MKRYGRGWRLAKQSRCAFCRVDIATVPRPVVAALSGVTYCSRECARGAEQYQRELEAARAVVNTKGVD